MLQFPRFTKNEQPIFALRLPLDIFPSNICYDQNRKAETGKKAL